jgi:hypothetical protein
LREYCAPKTTITISASEPKQRAFCSQKLLTFIPECQVFARIAFALAAAAEIWLVNQARIIGTPHRFKEKKKKRVRCNWSLMIF